MQVHTKNFEGRLYLNFDELPVASDNYKCISDSLKILSTEHIFTVRDMYTSPYQQKNTFNIILTVNNNAVSLTQSNKERYIVFDMDELLQGNFKYFEELSEAIDNDDAVIAFYQFLRERFDKLDLLHWNEDKSAPKTENTRLKEIEALPKIYKIIKEKKINEGLGIDMNTKEFFTWYYRVSEDRTSINKLGKMLKAIGILPKKFKVKDIQFRKYIMSHDELLETFKTRGWIDENVDFVYNSYDVRSCDDCELRNYRTRTINQYK